MITIEQRFIGSASFESICDRLAPGSQLTLISDLTGYRAQFGIVRARKLQHVRPDGSMRYVMEVIETRTAAADWYVILTLDRDFSGTDALSAYQQYRSLKKGSPGH